MQRDQTGWHHMSAAQAHMRRQATVNSPADQTTYTTPALGLFRAAVRRVMLIVRVQHVLTLQSIERTSKSAVETQWHTLYTSKEAKKLAFNPSLFSKSKAQAKVPGWAQRILAKPPSSRTGQECSKVQALIRGFASMARFTEKIQVALCRAATYLTVRPPRIILRKSHIGEMYYVIFSGSVFVNVQEKEPFVQTESILGPGDAFGELALLKEERRAATITCREECELLAVSKHVFSEICPKIFEAELEEKYKFASQICLFHPRYWTEEALREICFESQIQEYKTNQVVTSDQEEEWMYICMQGQCDVIKCLRLDREEVYSNIRNDEESRITVEFLDSMRRPSMFNRRRPVRRRSSLRPEAKKRQMLRSMALPYSDDQPKAEMNVFRRCQDDATSKGSDVSTRKVVGGTSLLALMLAASQTSHSHVYLHIGTLDPRNVYDLHGVLSVYKQQSAAGLSQVVDSQMMLVSGGARLLRIRRCSFLSAASEGALEHARLLAAVNRYPSDEVLKACLQQRRRWTDYKQRVVSEVTTPLSRSHSHSHSVQDSRRQRRAKSALSRTCQSPAPPVKPRTRSPLSMLPASDDGDSLHERLYKHTGQNDPYAIDRLLYRQGTAAHYRLQSAKERLLGTDAVHHARN